MDAKGTRVWVVTWAELIEAAKHRLKFVQQHLGYQPDTQQALDYLRAMHRNLLPDVLADGGGEGMGAEADEEPSA